MDTTDTLALDNLNLTVTETAGTLTYTFFPHSGWRPDFPVISMLLFFILPFGLLGLIGYALDATRGTRPEWEVGLTALFAIQLVVWGAVCAGTFTGGLRRWWFYRRGITLAFTDAGVFHSGAETCALAELRGLRLFVYPVVIRYLADNPLPRNTPPDTRVPPIPPELAPIPPGDRPPDKTQAALSLVIGDEGYTHGLVAGFDATALRTLADDMYRRLNELRHSQGTLPQLPPVQVVETTETEMVKLQNTRPSTGRTRRTVALLEIGMLAFTHRGVSTVWCLPMFAGLYGSGRLILAAGLGHWFLIGHVVLGFLHVVCLFGAWGVYGPIDQPPAKTDAK